MPPRASPTAPPLRRSAPAVPIPAGRRPGRSGLDADDVALLEAPVAACAGPRGQDLDRSRPRRGPRRRPRSADGVEPGPAQPERAVRAPVEPHRIRRPRCRRRDAPRRPRFRRDRVLRDLRRTDEHVAPAVPVHVARRREREARPAGARSREWRTPATPSASTSMVTGRERSPKIHERRAGLARRAVEQRGAHGDVGQPVSVHVAGTGDREAEVPDVARADPRRARGTVGRRESTTPEPRRPYTMYAAPRKNFSSSCSLPGSVAGWGSPGSPGTRSPSRPRRCRPPPRRRRGFAARREQAQAAVAELSGSIDAADAPEGTKTIAARLRSNAPVALLGRLILRRPLFGRGEPGRRCRRPLTSSRGGSRRVVLMLARHQVALLGPPGGRCRAARGSRRRTAERPNRTFTRCGRRPSPLTSPTSVGRPRSSSVSAPRMRKPRTPGTRSPPEVTRISRLLVHLPGDRPRRRR